MGFNVSSQFNFFGCMTKVPFGRKVSQDKKTLVENRTYIAQPYSLIFGSNKGNKVLLRAAYLFY